MGDTNGSGSRLVVVGIRNLAELVLREHRHQSVKDKRDQVCQTRLMAGCLSVEPFVSLYHCLPGSCVTRSTGGVEEKISDRISEVSLSLTVDAVSFSCTEVSYGWNRNQADGKDGGHMD